LQRGTSHEEDPAHVGVSQVRGHHDGVQQDPAGAPRRVQGSDEASDGTCRNESVGRRARDDARRRGESSTTGSRSGISLKKFKLLTKICLIN
jgi:hypothetical protein